MARTWTFGQKIAGGFIAVLVLSMVIGAVAIYALDAVVSAKDRVITHNARNLRDAWQLRAHATEKGSQGRGFLLTRDAAMLAKLAEARQQFADALVDLRGRASDAEARRQLDAIDTAERAHQVAVERSIELRKTDAAPDVVARQFDSDVLPRRDELHQRVADFEAREQRMLEDGRDAASATAGSAIVTVAAVAGGALVLSIIVALVLTRTLGRQIGSAVQHVQSSSAELQAASSQQSTSAREQATAMSEITTTISELLATSKQIAESARRVATIADDTTKAARSGDLTVGKTSESIAGIKRQVDLIVTHMLDLGKKSQQIGAILELINELAEQTNILAINATIEAAGAGDSGKRFAVVADEIRKLADRVGASTKEIRGLIDEIRGAVNTTVMTTEGGTKAVEAGARQFAEVTAAFKQIAGLVGTTTDAAREIELSTKQQSTAVEQVNVAVANVAQATKETEASSGQTLQTAGELTKLSRDLLRLIQPQASA